jgi:hypothetical protein
VFGIVAAITKSITPNKATSIAEALTLRTASKYDEPLIE